jgi:glutamate formiminotransferase/formiminotetrahydrofolate cyclodeaminase
LKEAIVNDPARAPDFGPSRLGKAGATVIGARAPLIAFNVYLGTGDVEIARKIARAIRQSSGGFRYLKALGMLVEGRAQVSMNFTDFTQTPLHRVVEMIRREAERYGVTVDHSELVGLIPQAALIDTARWYLQLDQFQPDQVLETRLYTALGAETSGEGAFLDRLSEGAATPGGGSAAAYAGAMAAALVGMVARLTIGKKKYAALEPRMREIASAADLLRKRMEQAVAFDAAAFDAVMASLRMPKGSPAEQQARGAALEAATRRAGEVPLGVAQDAVAALELAAEVAEAGNPSAVSDAASAGALAQAALSAAALNVRVNVKSLKDQSTAAGWREALSSLDARAAAAQRKLQHALSERLG